MAERGLAASLAVVCALLVTTCHSASMVRPQQQQQLQELSSVLKKRTSDGNPCPNAEKPFPCKSSATCLPMAYVCDSNIDCEDGFDEDKELCAAAKRPPIEDIMDFLHAEKSWIIDNLFAGREIAKVAHALVVSQTLEDFRQRMSMTPKEISALKAALLATEKGNAREMLSLGMPPSAWSEVLFIFSKLAKSGLQA